MILRERYYFSDKGKHFVLTEKGKKYCASYRDKAVGEPVSEYDVEATCRDVENGYLQEVDIPDWIVKTGYKVVYDYNGYILSVGNPVIFPEKILAENYKENHEWMRHQMYIHEAIYEGKALVPCIKYNGKFVYNKSWYYGVDALKIGDYVEEDIVSSLVNCLPPASWRSDYFQLGEPASHQTDENGKMRATYATFRKIAKDIWEYCGECFRGKNVSYKRKSGQC